MRQRTLLEQSIFNAGLTVSAVAKRLGRNIAGVNETVKGTRKGTRPMAKELAEFLGGNVSDFFDERLMAK
jgi:plasmid maintenance system antidote protein VapI